MLYYLQAIILGIIQGVTEFLPISSTAHLIISEKILGLNQDTYGLSFDMFINLGTVLAVIWFFRVKLLEILHTPKRLGIILVASIPAGLAGLLLENSIDGSFRSIDVIATSLIVVGLIMMAVEKLPHREVTPRDSHILGMGVAQAIALIPGVSRSGITISAGMASGLNRVTAAEYSFLLSVPITAAAVLKRLIPFLSDVSAGSVAAPVLNFYIVGLIASTIAGYFTLKFLLDFYSRYSLTVFAWYRITLAILLLLFLR
jgi:undecaprenyl-diphosphatase